MKLSLHSKAHGNIIGKLENEVLFLWIFIDFLKFVNDMKS